MWNQVEKNPFLPKVLFITVFYTAVESLTIDMFLQQSSGGVLVTKKQNKTKNCPGDSCLSSLREVRVDACARYWQGPVHGTSNTHKGHVESPTMDHERTMEL